MLATAPMKLPKVEPAQGADVGHRDEEVHHPVVEHEAKQVQHDHRDVEEVDLSATFSAKSHHVSIQDSDMPHLNKIPIRTPAEV